MSAFIVEPETIVNIVNAGLNAAGQRDGLYVMLDGKYEVIRPGDTEMAQKLCDVLMAENVRSVDHRYSEKNDRQPVVFVRKLARFGGTTVQDIAQAFKSIDCLVYQSCETDDWEQSEAYGIVQSIRGQLWRKLPG